MNTVNILADDYRKTPCQVPSTTRGQNHVSRSVLSLTCLVVVHLSVKALDRAFSSAAHRSVSLLNKDYFLLAFQQSLKAQTKPAESAPCPLLSHCTFIPSKADVQPAFNSMYIHTCNTEVHRTDTQYLRSA